MPNHIDLLNLSDNQFNNNVQLNHEALALLVLHDLRIHNTQSFMLAGSEDLAALLPKLHLQDEGAEALILFRPLVHCIAIYMRVVNNQVHAYLFDPQGLGMRYSPVPPALDCLRAFFPDARIILSTDELQTRSHNQGCAQYSYFFLSYCAEQGTHLFTDYASPDNCQAAEDSNRVEYHVRDNLPETLKQIAMSVNPHWYVEYRKEQLLLLDQLIHAYYVDEHQQIDKQRVISVVKTLQGIDLPIVKFFSDHRESTTRIVSKEGGRLEVHLDVIPHSNCLLYSRQLLPVKSADSLFCLFDGIPGILVSHDPVGSKLVIDAASRSDLMGALADLQHHEERLWNAHMRQLGGLQAVINDIRFELELQEICQNADGGFTQHQVQLALQAALESKQSVYVPGIEMMSGEKAVFSLDSLREDGYRHVAFSFQSSSHHQIAVWITLGEAAHAVALYDSNGNASITAEAKQRLQDMLCLETRDSFQSVAFPFPHQSDEWSCGVHVFDLLTHLAEVNDLSHLGIRQKAKCLYTLYYQEANRIQALELARAKNQQRIQTLLDRIEQYRQNHILSASSNGGDFLTPVSDYLKKAYQSRLSFSELLNGYDGSDRQMLSLILKIADKRHNMSSSGWRVVFNLVEGRQLPPAMHRRILPVFQKEISEDLSHEQRTSLIDIITNGVQPSFKDILAEVINNVFQEAKEAAQFEQWIKNEGGFDASNARALCYHLLCWLIQQDDQTERLELSRIRRIQSERKALNAAIKNSVQSILQKNDIPQEEIDRLLNNGGLTHRFLVQIAHLSQNGLDTLALDVRVAFLLFLSHDLSRQLALAGKLPWHDESFRKLFLSWLIASDKRQLLTLFDKQALEDSVYHNQIFSSTIRINTDAFDESSVFEHLCIHHLIEYLCADNKNLTRMIKSSEHLIRLVKAFPLHKENIYTSLCDNYADFRRLVLRDNHSWLDTVGLFPQYAAQLFEQVWTNTDDFYRLIANSSCAFFRTVKTFPEQADRLYKELRGNLPVFNDLLKSRNSTWLKTIRYFKEHAEPLFREVEQNPRDFQHLVMHSHETWLNTAIQLPEFADDLVDHLLQQPDTFRRLVDTHYLLVLTARKLPSQSNRLIEYVLKSKEDFWHLVMQNANTWLGTVNQFPQHEEQLVQCLLEDPDNFRRLVSSHYILIQIVRQARNYKHCVMRYILNSEREFARLVIKDIHTLRSIADHVPDVANEIFVRLCNSPIDFKRMVMYNKNTFLRAAQQFPEHSQWLFEQVWSNADEFNRLMSPDGNALLKTIRHYSEQREQLFERVWNSPEAYERTVHGSLDSFINMARAFPAHEVRLIDRLLSNQDAWNRLQGAGYQWIKAITQLPKSADRLFDYGLNCPERFKRLIADNYQFIEAIKSLPHFAATLICFVLSRPDDIRRLITCDNRAWLNTVRQLPRQVELMPECIFNNPNDFRRLVQQSNHTWLSTIQQFPEQTDFLVSCVFDEPESFRRLVLENKYTWLNTIRQLPKQLELLVKRVMENPEDFNRMVMHDADTFRIAIQHLPQYKKTLIKMALSSPHGIKLLFDRRFQLNDLIEHYPKYADSLLNWVLCRPDYFKTQLRYPSCLRQLARQCPEHADRLLEWVLSRHDEAQRLLFCNNNEWVSTAACFPDHAERLFNQVWSVPDLTRRLVFESNLDWRNTAKAFPQHQTKLFEPVWNNPTEFKRLVTYDLKVWSDTVKAFPMHKDRLIERIWSNQDDFNQLVLRNIYSWMRMTTVVPEKREQLFELVWGNQALFSRILNHNDALLTAVKKFPEHRDRLLERLLNNDEDFHRLIRNIEAWFRAITECPDFSERLIDRVLNNRNEFNRLVRNTEDLLKVAAQPRPLVKGIMEQVLKSNEEEFKKLVSSSTDFIKILEHFPDFRLALYQRVQTNQYQFERLVMENARSWEHLTVLIPEHSDSLFRLFWNNPIYFSHLIISENNNCFSTSNLLIHTAQIFPMYADMLIERVLNDEEIFRRMIGWNWHLFWQTVDKFPHYADELFERIWNRQEYYQQLITKNTYYWGTAAQRFPLRTPEIFERVWDSPKDCERLILNDLDNFLLTTHYFPEHAEKLFERLWRSNTQFINLVSSRASNFIRFVKKFPNHAQALFDRCWNSDEGFLCLANRNRLFYFEFFNIVSEFPDYSRERFERVLDDPADFRKLMAATLNSWIYAIKRLPHHAHELIERVLTNPIDFARLVTCEQDWIKLIEELPQYAGMLFESIFRNQPAFFRRRFSSTDTLVRIARIIPQSADLLLECVLKQPEEFRRVIENSYDLNLIIAKYPLYAAGLREQFAEIQRQDAKAVTDSQPRPSGTAQQSQTSNTNGLKLFFGRNLQGERSAPSEEHHPCVPCRLS
ncbi:hypothetical protein [Legionella worsleiensis]|uniref:Uncharacterized protein n=1 Tax=Legionella worsleiensis TaxID=45076 RepID=A0A0W1AJX4_9GAMM|nr:hypothetical protein [Legionella worsleiensis]KTD81653.1 hypothetical protein Lwor_0435 [Legionella worsleiensis]STY31937.1 Uncharacterised protein [Legionella worsleiensis]